MKEKVSVVVPSLNSRTIDRTVASLRRQSYGLSHLEIIVVGLDELGLVEQDEHVRFVSSGRPVCAAAARNLGMARATGATICFTDADCVAAEDWVETMVQCHQGDRRTIGGAVAYEVDNYWALCDNISMFHEFLPSTTRGPRPYLATLNLSVARDVAMAVGPFDEGFAGASGEDIDWTIRIRLLGCELHFEPCAVVHHCPSRGTLRDVLAHWLRSGQNMIQVRLRYARLYRTPRFMRDERWLLILSPVIAAYVTLRIYLSDLSLLRHLHTIPVVFLTKVAWCVGAARWIRHEKRGR